MNAAMTKLDVLKKYFGYSSFRGGQEDIINNILNQRDVLGVMPTGAGKSLCFQVPALMFSGITLVISPLVSLMKDQVQALIENNISAAFFNSTLTQGQMRKALINAKEGKYKIIYVAPERLEVEEFLSFAKDADISMIAVDEAHCVSQWGQDFRPSYLNVSSFIDKLKKRPIVSAFTATATSEVKDDIINLLKLKEPFTMTTGYNRSNLYFEVQKPVDKYAAITKYLTNNSEKSGIIYCLTRKSVEEICDKLIKDGYSATRYHAGLSEVERRENQDDFIYDKKIIMVATNAFGMGIDKSNVSFVIHYNMPKDIESYYQEAGRAGRDGTSAECILLYGGQDVVTNNFLIDNSEENAELSFETVQKIKEKERERLKRMTLYCHTTECLREYIIKYFGDKTENFCGNCINCNTNFEEVDITEEAQKILSCAYRLNGRYGTKILIDVLRGSKAEKINRFNLNTISTYGIMASVKEKRLKDIINYLVLKEYMCVTNTEFPVVKLTEKSKLILFENEKIKMKLTREVEETRQREVKKKEVADEVLFAKLKTLRMEIAKQEGVPAFIVFSDAVLIDMCRVMPHNEQEFLEVSGVGQAKLNRYGKEFLEVIRNYTK